MRTEDKIALSFLVFLVTVVVSGSLIYSQMNADYNRACVDRGGRVGAIDGVHGCYPADIRRIPME